MNNMTRRFNEALGSLRRLLCASLAVWVIGVASSPASATVTVDQVPLTTQPNLPPNIVLMLDDSGSMAWDYMPDWDYLDTSAKALVNSKNNGVYYDPTVVYTPPVKADGTRYPDATGLTRAWNNGFDTSEGTSDLTVYSSSKINYSKQVGTSSKTVTRTAVDNDQCSALYATQAGAYSKSWSADSAGSILGTCTIKYYQYAYFRYSTVSAGVYTMHFVAATDCGTQTNNCVLASDTSGVAAPNKDVAGQTLLDQAGDPLTAGQNIANWFAYYHTRILMTKSGLMSAFAGVDATYRVGFGSIDGGTQEVCTGDWNGQSFQYYCGNQNYQNLPSDRYSYTDSYNGGGTNYVAQVKPFGLGTDAASQKSAFWNWVSAAKASGGTPLRQALDSVGQYYETDQPWKTSATDTAELACRQSYTILTTDGFWNGPVPSDIGNADEAGTVINMTGPNNRTYKESLGLPYSDGYSDTLADVAMKYWKTDLRTSLLNEVPVNDDDPAFWQHMTTFTLGLGFSPLYSDQSTQIPMTQVEKWANGDSTAAISNFAWPEPDGLPIGSGGSINNIADMAHAAINGRGSFASAKSSAEFAQAMKNALAKADTRRGTGASLAANSTRLDTGTFVYQANYYTSIWKGELKALAVNSVTGELDLNPTWTASGQMPVAGSRSIYTTTDGSTLVAFKNSSTTTTTAVPPALGTELSALGADASAQAAMVDYLRGDHSKELSHTGGVYRDRDTPLGDIVDSQPVYVGVPNPNEFYNQTFTGNNKVTTFDAAGVPTSTGVSYVDDFAKATKQLERTPMLYVAANDGMLHGFNAGTGVETFAYLPKAVIKNGIKDLSDPDYSHQFFNDGELTVADVFKEDPASVDGSGTWHTVLVGTTGRGTAKAVYALDVTDPANITLLWERSAGDGSTLDTNSGYIGQMTGKPVIAQTADAEWSVLMGNGYNSTNGTAALLQFDVFTGVLSVHATDTSTDNGLAAPAIWMDTASNGISTIAYAGDRKGRVWSFVLNASTPHSNGLHGANEVITYTYDSQRESPGSLLYTATKTDANGVSQAQPITAGLLVGKDPTTSNVWVFFGTGSYLSAGDLTNSSTQTWYGLIVRSSTSSSVVTSSSTRSNLVQRSIVAEAAATSTTLASRAVSNQTDNTDMTGKQGWYMDLLSAGTTAQGERMVTPNQFQGNLLLATSRIPDNSDACNPSGRGWIMAVSPFTGANPKDNFFDLNGDGSLNSLDNVSTGTDTSSPAAGAGFDSLPNNPIFVGSVMLVSFDNGSTSSVQTSSSTGLTERVSWRELTND